MVERKIRIIEAFDVLSMVEYVKGTCGQMIEVEWRGKEIAVSSRT